MLVLDEPTCALDGESAGVVRDAVRGLTGKESLATMREGMMGHGARVPVRNESLRKDPWSRDAASTDVTTSDGMAIILITHSVEMMRVASHIIVLEQGRVVQEGRFKKLARRRGPFVKLISGGVEGWRCALGCLINF